MRNLLLSRVTDCHFILEDDQNSVRYWKYKSLFDRLRSLSPETKIALERKAGGKQIVQAIDTCLESKLRDLPQPPLPEEERSEIDDWWE